MSNITLEFEEKDVNYWGDIEYTDDYYYPEVIDFKSGEIVTFESSEGITINFKTNGKFISIEFEDEDGYPMDIEVPDNDGEISIKWKSWEVVSGKFYNVIIEEETETEPEPFNNVYKIDSNILKELMKEKIIVSSGETAEYLDKSEFIINVLELPYIVDSSLIDDVDSFINLGDFTSKVKAPKLKQDRLILDMGTITIPKKFNNSYDYINTDINLHLPFNKAVKLNPEYVIGFDLKIEYIIDVYTGDTTINIISSNGDIVIDSIGSTIGRDIPIIMVDKKIGRMSKENSLMNGIDTPFIEVIRNKVVDYNIFNNMVLKQSKLKDVKGYLKVDEINLETTATLQEQEEIKMLLKQGINIK